MRRSGFLTVVLLAAALLAPPAGAWNATGHEQVADIAWARLSKPVRAQVIQILMAGDPAFRPKSVDNEASVRSAFRRAATFPDVIKGDRQTQYEALVVALNSRWKPETDPLVSAREKDRCRTWHYYDTPIRFRGARPAVPESNALNALGLARKEMLRLQASGTPDRKLQCWWLYWMNHLVGDLHQPLHCSESFEFVTRDGDDGGNQFKIRQPPAGEELRLHAFWDDGIERARLEERAAGKVNRVDAVTKRWLAEPALKPAEADARNLDIKSWLEAGAKLADTQVYTGVQQGAVPSSAYTTASSTLCRKQAVLAGYRLAAMLEEILEP